MKSPEQQLEELAADQIIFNDRTFTADELSQYLLDVIEFEFNGTAIPISNDTQHFVLRDTEDGWIFHLRSQLLYDPMVAFLKPFALNIRKILPYSNFREFVDCKMPGNKIPRDMQEAS